MIVMKFGGTSVASGEAIARTIGIIRERLDRKPVVVVSALSRVTDLLYKICDAAAAGLCEEASAHIASLQERHLGIVAELIPDSRSRLHTDAAAEVTRICQRLHSLVEAVCTLGELTARIKARIISCGELLSSTVICYAMNAAGIATGFIDARRIIVTTGSYLKGEPDIEAICRLVPPAVEQAYSGMQAVITQGFISSTTDGEPSVLGRGGSDYTASLIGMAVDAEAIEIWTDVDGVRTTDPRRVAYTKSIERISFEEAAEMAHFGAKVLHPLTIEPAVMKNIPVYVLNSMNPAGKGTVILQGDQIPDGAKSLTFKENIWMLNIFSPRMINVPGFLSRVFGIFAANNVSVDLISTSEANISVTLDSDENLDRVVEALSEFAQVRVDDQRSQVSIIGKNVVNQKGLLRWANAAFNNTTIAMISQGASSVNISYVVERKELDEVLQELHNYLFEF